METFHTVATLADLKPGECRSVEAEGISIAIYNVDGRIYATENTCPHAGGPLGEGILTGTHVVCPWHGWRYNVINGERPENPDFKVACFPVEIQGNEIRVLLPEG